VPFLKDKWSRNGQQDRVTVQIIHEARDHCVQGEDPQDEIRQALTQLMTRTSMAHEPRDQPAHGMATLYEVHHHECQYEKPNDGVISGTRVA
jgi:hypothetical protein